MDYKALKKEWLAAGEIPNWMSSNGVQLFCEKYSFNNDTYKQRIQAGAGYLASNSPNVYPDWWHEDAYTAGKDYAQVFFNVQWDGFVTGSTPLIANGGTDRGMTVSCSGQYMRPTIYHSNDAVTELAVLTKYGHGTSVCIDDWPCAGTDIGDGNYSKGVMPIIKKLIAEIDEVSQGVRRGSAAYYLSIDHGDFYTVAQHLHENPDSNNVGWLISDEFIERLKAGDKEAIARWNKVIYVRMTKGKGYICKIDNFNRTMAEAFKRDAEVFRGSNLCVAPETKILTDRGYQTISELVGQEVNVWNGEEWSGVVVQKTGENQKLVKVKLKDADRRYNLTCTPYHKFYLSDGSMVRASELKRGDALLAWSDYLGVDQQHYVVSVRDEGRVGDTYCFTESKRGMGVFNGILTGNCIDMNLPSSDKLTFTCVLLSLNLLECRNWPKNLAKIAHLMQDANVTGYLKQIESLSEHNRLAMQKAYNFTKRYRAVGTGTYGFHSLLMKERIVWGSLDSFYLNAKIFKQIHAEIADVNRWLAATLGEPEGCVGLGIRNATTTAGQPTKSSAELSKGSPSESINPQTALVKIKESSGGELVRIDTVFLDYLKENGLYTDELIRKVAKNKGSVQGIDEIPKDMQQVFATAFEVKMEDHLNLCSQRRKYIDNNQSLNLYFTGSDSPESIAGIHKQALLDPECNGLYYCYSMRGGNITRTTECFSCQ